MEITIMTSLFAKWNVEINHATNLDKLPLGAK
jgi:hypothetical protein